MFFGHSLGGLVVKEVGSTHMSSHGIPELEAVLIFDASLGYMQSRFGRVRESTLPGRYPKYIRGIFLWSSK